MPDKGRMQMVVQPFRMTAFGQYEDDDSGSTCKQRDYKDATDLVVQPVNVTQDTVAGPLDSHYWKGPGSRQGGEREYVGVVQPVTQLPIGLDEEQNAVVDGFGTLKARMLGGGFEGTVAVCTTGYRTHTRKAEGFDGSEDGTGRGTPIVPAIAFQLVSDRANPSVSVSEDRAFTLSANPMSDRGQAIAFHPTQDPISSVEVTHALDTGSKGGCATAAVATTMAVRRLLPVECERLQGFPDDHTNIPWRGKPAPDSPRYKAMGNSMAVPVMRWIGQRLDRVAKGDL